MPFPFRLVKRSQHYNVANKDLFVIPIELLTNECIECTLFSSSIGQDALNNVAQKINLQQPEYFGLLFKSRKNVDQWVDLSRPLKKQLDKHAIETRLYFRLQFFVPNFHFLTDEASRYHYFCAMKGLVIDGRIACSRDDAILLASFSLQAEFGDYTPERHTVEYLNNFALFPKAMVMSKFALDVLIECAINAYRNLQGVPTNVAEIYYISEAQQRDGYGQEGFPAKDLDLGHDVCLGVCIRGIFVVNTETNTVELFKWMDIANLIHQKKVFTIERNADNYRKNYSTFDSDYASCIWKICVEQHQYFMKGIQNISDLNEQQGIALNNNALGLQNMQNLQNPSAFFMPNSAELFAQIQQQLQQQSQQQKQQQQQQQQQSHISQQDLSQTYQPNNIQLNSSSLQAINSIQHSLVQHSQHSQQQQQQQQQQQNGNIPNQQNTQQVPFYKSVDNSLSHLITPGPIQKSQSLIENVNMENGQMGHGNGTRPRTSTEPPIELTQIHLQDSELNPGFYEQQQINNASQNSTPIYENAPNGSDLTIDEKKKLLPAYKSPPDYETFLKQRQRFHSNSNVAVLAAARAMCLSQSLSSIPSRLASHNQINSASSSSSLAIGQQAANNILGSSNIRQHLQQQQAQQNNNTVTQQQHQHHSGMIPQQNHHMNLQNMNHNQQQQNMLTSDPQQVSQQQQQQQQSQKTYPSIYKNYNDLSLLTSNNSDSVSDLLKPGMMFTASSPELNNLLQKRLANSNEKSVHFRTPEPLLNHESNLRKSKLSSAFASVPDLTFSNRHVLENIYENPSDYHPLPTEKSSKMLKRFNLFHFAPKNLRLLSSHASAGSEPNLFNSKINTSTNRLSSEHLNSDAYHGNVYSPAHQQKQQQQQQQQQTYPLPHPQQQQQQQQSHQLSHHSQQNHSQATHSLLHQAPSQQSQPQGPPFNHVSHSITAQHGHQAQVHSSQQPIARQNFSHTQAIYANVNGSSHVSGTNHLTGSYGHLAGQGSAPPTQPPPPPPAINSSNGNVSLLQQTSQHSFTQQQQQQQHPQHYQSQQQHHSQLQSQFQASTIVQHPQTVSLTGGKIENTSVNNAGNSAVNNGTTFNPGSTVIAISSNAVASSGTADNCRNNATGRFLQTPARINDNILPSINDHQTQQRATMSTNDSVPNNTSTKSNFTFPSNSRLIIFNKQVVQDHEFTREFELLPRMNPIAKFTTASLPENILKNRFRDILPYEENRVKLTPTKDNKHGYINASHVKMALDGDITQHYIAAQGPLPNTTLDFWQMVWEKSINLIVMVTNFTESGSPKCFTYLPLCNDTGKSIARFGDFEISCNYTTISPTYITSFLTVSHGHEKRSVTHLRYTDWNDHSIPGDLQGFLSFLSEMDSIYRRSSREGSGFGKKKSNSNLQIQCGPPPILVHCSAGAGRSGVVILCDALLKYLDHNLHEPIDISDALIRLRFQRMISVQHCEQFRFVCQVLSQHLANTRLI